MEAIYYRLKDFNKYTSGGSISDYSNIDGYRQDIGIEINNNTTSVPSNRAYITLPLYNINIFDIVSLKFKVKGMGKLYVGFEGAGGVRRQYEFIELDDSFKYVNLKFQASRNETHTIVIGGVASHDVNAIITNVLVTSDSNSIINIKKELVGTIQTTSTGTFSARNDLGLDEIETVTMMGETLTVSFKEQLPRVGIPFVSVRHSGPGAKYIAKVAPVDGKTITIKIQKDFLTSFMQISEVEQWVYIDIVYKS